MAAERTIAEIVEAALAMAAEAKASGDADLVETATSALKDAIGRLKADAAYVHRSGLPAYEQRRLRNEDILRDCRAGMTLSRLAEVYSLSGARIMQICIQAGVKPSGGWMTDAEYRSRNREIARERMAGATLRKIALKYGLSVEQVRGICMKQERIIAALYSCFAVVQSAQYGRLVRQDRDVQFDPSSLVIRLLPDLPRKNAALAFCEAVVSGFGSSPEAT